MKINQTHINITTIILGIFLICKPLHYWIKNPELTQMQVIVDQWYYLVMFVGVMCVYWLVIDKVKR